MIDDCFVKFPSDQDGGCNTARRSLKAAQDVAAVQCKGIGW